MELGDDDSENKSGYITVVSDYAKLNSKIRYLIVKTWLILRNIPKAKDTFSKPLLTSLRFLIKMEGFYAKFKDGREYASDDVFKFYDLRSKNYAEFSRSGITIKHAERGACEEVFSGVYDWLPVFGKTVLDIGANIGDSAIYFATRGAKHVFGLEVNPATYNIALDNIKTNNLEDLITVKNWGIGKEEVQIDPDNLGKGGFQISSSEKGIKIPMYSLEKVTAYLIRFLPNSEFVMKIDCEGCEYDTILNTNESTLNLYTSIIGEYHHGYTAIKQKLERAGFKTKFSKPTFNPTLFVDIGGGLVGTFKAWKE